MEIQEFILREYIYTESVYHLKIMISHIWIFEATEAADFMLLMFI